MQVLSKTLVLNAVIIAELNEVLAENQVIFLRREPISVLNNSREVLVRYLTRVFFLFFVVVNLFEAFLQNLVDFLDFKSVDQPERVFVDGSVERVLFGK